ncbi:MAG: response regulator [Desulfobacterales bacterium]|nr:response regulator [Desulfobacterales bacterium]
MAKASEKRILVIDDEPDVRNFLAACIEDAGFTVDTAVDGMDAMEKVKANTPDLMTLDMVMPRQSGIKFLRELRRSGSWSNIPVIVITAHAHDELGSEDIKGFNALVTGHRPRITMEKPITPAKLVKAISDILEVEAEEGEVSAPLFEKNSLINMIKEADSETLEEVRNLLNKK